MAKKQLDSTSSDHLKDIIVEAILEKKGQDVVSLDLRAIPDTIAHYFIIAHGDSSTQVNAIFQSIYEDAKKQGILPYHSEGQKNGEWIIVDFVDVVAHIFYREKRDFYQLEELWHDAKITKHGDAAAINEKAVRPSKGKTIGKKKAFDDEEYVLEDLSPKKPVRRLGNGRPVASRDAALRIKGAKKSTGLKSKKTLEDKSEKPPRRAAAKKAPARVTAAGERAVARKAVASKKAATKNVKTKETSSDSASPKAKAPIKKVAAKKSAPKKK